MPRVEFPRTRFAVDAEDGARLVDLSDEHPLAAVPYGCRHANCAQCRVTVETSDGATVDAPEAPEAALLARFGDPPGMRLGCQLVVRGAGIVRISPLR